MNIAAIETMYNGILFRSRLEATWAAFFDLCGWEWVYEPFDLNGWVPDFELLTKTKRRVLCEVKPEDLHRYSGIDINKSAYSKALRHVYDFNLLLLGVGPFSKESESSIGLLITASEIGQEDGVYIDDKKYYWELDEAAFHVDNGQYGFGQVLRSWDDWMGKTDRKSSDWRKESFMMFNYAKNIARKQYN